MSHEQPGLNEYRTVTNITAKCREGDCRFIANDKLTYETRFGDVAFSPLIVDCQMHHKNTQHYQFFLYKNKKKVGFVTVSSDSLCGTIDL